MFFYPDIFAWTVNPEMSLPYASSMKLFVSIYMYSHFVLFDANLELFWWKGYMLEGWLRLKPFLVDRIWVSINVYRHNEDCEYVNNVKNLV